VLSFECFVYFLRVGKDSVFGQNRKISGYSFQVQWQEIKGFQVIRGGFKGKTGLKEGILSKMGGKKVTGVQKDLKK